MSVRRKALIPVILLLGMLSACSTDDTYLPALLADPMAEYEAEGIEFIDRGTQGYVASDVLGNKVPANVRTRYRILDGSAIDGVLEEAITEAEGHGWALRLGTGPTSRVGSKELSIGEGELILAIIPSDPEDPDGSLQRLLISLSISP
jgi:hypothetical protein